MKKLTDRKIEQVIDFNELHGSHLRLLMRSMIKAQEVADEILENDEPDLNKSARAYKSTIDNIKSLKRFLS